MPVLNILFKLLFRVYQPGVSMIDTHNAILRIYLQDGEFPGQNHRQGSMEWQTARVMVS